MKTSVIVRYNHGVIWARLLVVKKRLLDTQGEEGQGIKSHSHFHVDSVTYESPGTHYRRYKYQHEYSTGARVAVELRFSP